jgi:hypothetical protein
VDVRTRKELLGQWGVRDPSPKEQAQGRALQAEVSGSALAGRPVQLRRRHFRPAADSYIASLGGPLPYMLRLREIERRTDAALAELDELWRELAVDCGEDAAAFAVEWSARARAYDFDEINRLIETHNRWYPTEARLPMDVRRRDYVLVGGQPYTRRPLDADWVLERFPPNLAAARAA